MSLLKYSIIILGVFIQSKVFAQSEEEPQNEIFTAKNVVYAEFAGNSGGYALNYGHTLYQKDRLKLQVSAGFSMLYRKGSERIFNQYWVPVIPLELSAFIGRSDHHLELGAGFFALRNRTYSFDETYPNNVREQIHWDQNILARLGYRYQKPEGGFFFRISYTPTVAFSNSDAAENQVSFVPFGMGVSLGLSF
ncbi:hypothetical protein SAMN04488104_100828 [Algoriphagus faecimaris]|uniref:Outer membrane protein beta-barrel domain-containing protein n=1 Tax=Algoriphagus faecimaris TaxID=686796 RepID=A0A1G6Q3Z5_9BACT|nr:hypothetical protein [Algoriphagus faecimaris]SDC87018.1 hypothetical protein SAMN04488104_100828 [Algoriphagus faecimaris]